MSESEPKIIVDDDWKEQVAKEKAAATEVGSQDQTDGKDDTSESSAGTQSPAPADGELPPPPPASFEVLISMMFSQALSMLGQMPDPGTGESRVNKHYAKHYIDTLEMLGEKTKGNLTDDESKMLSEALHALRMAYVGA